MIDLDAYVDYFKTVAINHKLIGHTEEEPHFSRMNLVELEQKLSQYLNFPAIALEDPYVPSSGSYPNLRESWRGALMVVFNVSDQSDYDTIQEARNTGMAICRQIRGKMINDRRKGLIEGLNPESFVIELSPEPIDNQFWIVRLSWTTSTQFENFDPQYWNNETVFEP